MLSSRFTHGCAIAALKSLAAMSPSRRGARSGQTPSPGSCSGTHSLLAGTPRFTPPEPINCAAAEAVLEREAASWVIGLGRRGRFRLGLQFGLRRPDLLGAPRSPDREPRSLRLGSSAWDRRSEPGRWQGVAAGRPSLASTEPPYLPEERRRLAITAKSSAAKPAFSVQQIGLSALSHAVRFTISAAAFDAIAATLPSSVGYERIRAPNGDYFIWLEPRYVDRLRAMRGPGESYSDVILRLAEA